MATSTEHETPATDAAAALERLAGLLERQIEGHRALLSRIEQKREALRTADLDAISRLCGEEHAIVQRLRSSDRERCGVMEELSAVLAPADREPLTVAGIAAAAGDAFRERLLGLLAELRTIAESVGRESSVVAAASRALSAHLTGIMQSVNGALSRVGVYGRRGRIDMGSQMEFCVDVTS